MAKRANLPKGFTITSINGKRCTQVPRSLTTIAGETSFATTTTEASSQTTSSTTSTTSTTPPPETATSSAQVQGNSPDVAASVIPISSAAPVAPIAPTPEAETTTSSTTPAAAATTSVAPAETVTSPVAPSTSTAETSSSASSTSIETTSTLSSSTSIPVAQSENSASPTSTEISNDGLPSLASSGSVTSNSAATASGSATPEISSSPKLAPAPVVGGVVGGIALIGIIGLLFWVFRRKRRRESLFTPSSTRTGEQFYEIDRGSVGPTKPLTKWKANLGFQTEKLRDAAGGLKAGLVGIAGSLKSKVSGDQSDTPSVNLNRGNSQFMDGPIPQHSRNNSSVLTNYAGNLTVKDRVSNWWERFRENVNFNRRLRRKQRQSMDPFASARSLTEKQSNINDPPDFSQLLGMEDRELQLQAERRRASLSQSFPSLGSLGLDFSSRTLAQSIVDPFADPPTNPNSNAKSQNQPWAAPNISSNPGQNPFADPITAPQRSIPKENTYISDIRRSRGMSGDATNLKSSNPSNNSSIPNLPPSNSANKATSIAPTSRYPSSIALTRDSYRDTVFSSFSANVRKGKGRSDPFDLERPELWRSNVQNPPMPAPRESTKDLYPNPLTTSQVPGQTNAPQSSQGAQPRVVSMNTARIVSATGTYASKYSSGMSSLGEWGDPGPDLGPGSAGSSIRANASSTDGTERLYGQGSGYMMQESSAEISPIGNEHMSWDQRRERNNMSPVSLESQVSSKGGVGKAM